MNIAKSVRVATAMRGITQKQMAALANINEVNLSKMINGKHGVSSEQLSRMAEAVDMKVSEFVALGEE